MLYEVITVITSALISAGGTCEAVMVNGNPYPDLSPAVREVSVTACNKLIGCLLSAEEMADVLRKMRYGAEASGPDTVRVNIPCYRADIMHDWDVFEDVAIGYGFDNLETVLPRAPTLSYNFV